MYLVRKYTYMYVRSTSIDRALAMYIWGWNTYIHKERRRGFKFTLRVLKGYLTEITWIFCWILEVFYFYSFFVLYLPNLSLCTIRITPTSNFDKELKRGDVGLKARNPVNFTMKRLSRVAALEIPLCLLSNLPISATVVIVDCWSITYLHTYTPR